MRFATRFFATTGAGASASKSTTTLAAVAAVFAASGLWIPIAVPGAIPASASALAQEAPAGAGASAKTAKTTATVLDLTLKGSMDEGPLPKGLDGAPVGVNPSAVAEILAKAAKDDAVKAAVLRLKSPGIGMAKADELRLAMKRFRESGKPLIAQLDAGGNMDYYLASGADEIAMPESGTLALKGLSSEVLFYRGLFDKLGIDTDYFQVGDYKGSGEIYTRSEMSPEFREELSEILNDRYDLLVSNVAERLGVAPADARKLMESGPYSASEAKARGLATKVAYEDELRDWLRSRLGVDEVKLDEEYGRSKRDADFSGIAGFMKLMQALSGDKAKAAKTSNPKIAVIHAAGTIDVGKSSPGSILGSGTLGSETFIANLRQAEADETVKAIVIRVDSPGGSALASDLMWREIVRIKASKPIVASMSDVAASGGYYISMPCTKIYASPGTLTGSIGVVGGKFSVSGLMEKAGLKVEVVSVGANTGLESPYRPLNDAERAAVLKSMREVYRQFTSKAAEGRGMPLEKLEALAGGRVYSGRRAKEIGLVDELGTLDDAIEAAKRMTGLENDATAGLLVLPEPPGLLDGLLGPLGGMGLSWNSIPGLAAARVSGGDLAWEALAATLPESAREALARFRAMRAILERETSVLMPPFELRVR